MTFEECIEELKSMVPDGGFYEAVVGFDFGEYFYRVAAQPKELDHRILSGGSNKSIEDAMTRLLKRIEEEMK